MTDSDERPSFDDEVAVWCAACARLFHVPPREANAEGPVCCSEECEQRMREAG